MAAVAADPKDMGGWERGGAYDRLYNPQERDKFKGTVVDVVEVVPMTGMSPGVALLVKDAEGDEVPVHLGPRWFVDPKSIGIKKGDRVTVKGVWVELDDRDLVMASKVSKGDTYEYKVRLTADGTPFWTMTPEQLAKERAGD
ncbi:MAG: hypothetical protein COT06_00410 [Syntrophobacteraceae bacterium CG07_land_8_20_14_0_80_61_8]|nr:MAG: hypothetical protein COT06_00410 [Syntrophobacteraceae bacterium CG07_land_8_20_14_0_80_61_8]